ncbi:extracellular protein 28-1 [Teratosphaeria destructans]|uniref:Extracellular protein 28-1 n=1 Tax=Teratosphaeria destructans TaxID=418781 RepID=A0A9W7SY75_9PEZI|nr:extracellular protein 28-1 [Teratosphaeria destructans]
MHLFTIIGLAASAAAWSYYHDCRCHSTIDRVANNDVTTKACKKLSADTSNYQYKQDWQQQCHGETETIHNGDWENLCRSEGKSQEFFQWCWNKDTDGGDGYYGTGLPKRDRR